MASLTFAALGASLSCTVTFDVSSCSVLIFLSRLPASHVSGYHVPLLSCTESTYNRRWTNEVTSHRHLCLMAKAKKYSRSKWISRSSFLSQPVGGFALLHSCTGDRPINQLPANRVGAAHCFGPVILHLVLIANRYSFKCLVQRPFIERLLSSQVGILRLYWKYALFFSNHGTRQFIDINQYNDWDCLWLRLT